MSAVDHLTDPAVVMHTLTQIENDLALRQGFYEAAALKWFQAQREIGRVKAIALLGSDAPSVTAKKAEGDLAAYDVEGAAAEAEYESLKAVIRVLEQRSMVCMAILKAQSHIS